MKKLAIAAATAAAMFTATAANASLFTFGVYQEGQTGQTLQYTPTGTLGGTISTIGSPTVDFKFFQEVGGTPLPAILLSNQPANFSFSATSNSTAWSLGGIVAQTFQTGHISLTLPNSIGYGTGTGLNLLSFDFTNLQLTSVGGGSASLVASTVPPMSIFPGVQASVFTNFTSDFFDFSNVVDKNMSLNMTALIPQLTVTATGTDNSIPGLPFTTGYIGGFTANSGGSFSTDPAPVYVPEPAMLGLFGFGAVGLAFARRRKK